jgi:hypothetical protein
MPRVFPSQIVDLIDKSFPHFLSGQSPHVDRGVAGQYLALFRLIDALPQEFLTRGGQAYSDFLTCLETMREHHEISRGNEGKHIVFGSPPGIQQNPIQVIRAYLAACPDQIPAETITALPFITDAALRESIRLDLSTAASSLHNGEWKAATVIAGAACEALLLWALDHDRGQAEGAAKSLPKPPKNGLEHWGLDTMIVVAHELRLIQEDTAKQAEIAKNFRNLIHPGRARRTQQPCDKATAYAGIAAAEAIARDLESVFR